MQTELDFSRRSYDEAMDSLIKSNETQIALIKERENFTTKQLLEMEHKMKNFREEKEKTTLGIGIVPNSFTSNNNNILSK